MRVLSTFALLLALTAGLALADQWVGWVTDEKCAQTGTFTGEKHKNCVNSGGTVVFVNEADKKIYHLSDADKAKKFVGQKVTMQGSAKDDTIEVESVTPAS